MQKDRTALEREYEELDYLFNLHKQSYYDAVRRGDRKGSENFFERMYEILEKQKRIAYELDMV